MLNLKKKIEALDFINSVNEATDLLKDKITNLEISAFLLERKISNIYSMMREIQYILSPDKMRALDTMWKELLSPEEYQKMGKLFKALCEPCPPPL